MAMLKFHAREDKLVREPNVRMVIGAKAAYVGRRWDEKLGGFVATEEPFAIREDSEEGQRLALLCVRDGSLWPADEATAAAVGAPFVPVKLQDGAWVATQIAVPKSDESRAARRAAKE